MKKLLFLLLLFSATLLMVAQGPADYRQLSNEELVQQLDKNRFSETYKSKWDIISEQNVAWVHRLWRTFYIAENSLLQQSTLDQPLGAIIYEGIENGSIVAYGSSDDRFLHAMNLQEVKALQNIDWSGIQSFTVKEDWICLKDEGKVVGRIIGIAPLLDGKPVCWLYYPDAREYFIGFSVRTGDKRLDNLDKVFYNHSYIAAIDKRQ